MDEVKRIVIGLSGASGSQLAYHLMQVLARQKNIETYLIVSDSAKLTWELEMDIDISNLYRLANHVLEQDNIGACTASGSFPCDGMIIVPCSMKTIAGISCGYSDNLLLRSADVMIKEKRPLVICFRETPLSPIHLNNLSSLAQIHNIYLIPMMMSYYHKPKSIEEMENSLIGKILNVFNIQYDAYKRWQ